MSDYLLDTNHAVQFIATNPRLIQRIAASRAYGSTFSVSMTTVGELFFGVYASQRRTQNLQALKIFLNQVLIRDFTIIVAEEFGKIQGEQKAKGRPIPAPDVQITAVARINGLIVLTSDKHFSYIDQLQVEDWVTV